jgi:hypothetical protein
MLKDHPGEGASWLAARNGAYELGDDYYKVAGGIIRDPVSHMTEFRRRASSSSCP